MAERLHLAPGDRVLAIETDHGILLTPYDPHAERALEIAARAAKKYRNALRELVDAPMRGEIFFRVGLRVVKGQHSFNIPWTSNRVSNPRRRWTCVLVKAPVL